ncbi:MAG: transposase [Solobacterium sp.]|nr:transposase [Solobacterium sp.]
MRNDKDNYYLFRNFEKANVFGMIASIHTFGRDLSWNPHIHYDKQVVM